MSVTQPSVCHSAQCPSLSPVSVARLVSFAQPASITQPSVCSSASFLHCLSVTQHCLCPSLNQTLQLPAHRLCRLGALCVNVRMLSLSQSLSLTKDLTAGLSAGLSGTPLKMQNWRRVLQLELSVTASPKICVCYRHLSTGPLLAIFKIPTGPTREIWQGNSSIPRQHRTPA